MAGQLLLLQMVVLAAVLGAVAAVSVHESTNDFRDNRTQRLTAVAENIVSIPIVRERIGDPGAAMYLASEVDRAADLSGARLAEVLDPAGRVIVSTDPTRQERAADLGASDVLSGRGWTGDTVVDGRRSITAHVPVLTPTGQLVAIVAVSDPYPSLPATLRGAGARSMLYLGIGAGLGIIGSWLLARRIKKQTRGLEIGEIAALAEHREALLHSIREGVVAVSDTGVITVLNDSAQDLLGLPDGQVGLPIEQIDIEPAVRDFLRRGPVGQDVVISTRDRVLALSRSAATSQGRSIGSITTLRDSTELAALQSDLSSHRSVTDTLRAQTHEFANQLHTISGLTQLQEFDAVTDFIGVLTRRRAQISDAITEHIGDPAVAALLIAKTSLAAESSVRLTVDPRSSLPALPPALATDVITVVGNLIDNAVDASEGVREAQVTVHLRADGDGLHIRIQDSGPGVPEHLRGEIFARGVTSKPDQPGGRGIGLALVRIIAVQHGGTATVEDAPGGGALFRISLPITGFGDSKRPDGDAG